ncbi:hypothetical protein C8Q74DRAFT_257801 [Fomes fomentarius]|nr:hypothetical protein C8Q74DRAFT_257801 [Fomes fomentarius]
MAMCGWYNRVHETRASYVPPIVGLVSKIPARALHPSFPPHLHEHRYPSHDPRSPPQRTHGWDAPRSPKSSKPRSRLSTFRRRLHKMRGARRF